MVSLVLAVPDGFMSRWLCLSLFLLAGCQATPSTSRYSTFSDVASLAPGRGVASMPLEKRYGGVLRDGSAELRMRRVAENLRRNGDAWAVEDRCRLLNTDALNAFSMADGRIYLTRGLYEQIEDDVLIAAVLAHEYAHLAAGDHCRPPCGTTADALDREIHADTEALHRMNAAGIAPEALICVIEMTSDVQPAGWARVRIESISSVIGAGP